MTTNTPGRARMLLPLVMSAVFLLVAAGVVVVKTDLLPFTTSCGGVRTPVNLTASVEKAGLLTRLADEYNHTEHAGHCAQVQVTGMSSGDTTDALTRPWDTASFGPVPDVWSPAASSWTQILQQRLGPGRAGLVPAQAPSIAQTPLVIAMPKPMAEALGWPARQLGWGDLLELSKDPRGWGAHGHPEWGRFTLGKTNPTKSTSGLHATIGAYQAGTGTSGDLTVENVRDPAVLAFARGVENSVVHYGDTELTFLENLYDASRRGQGLTYISAVAVEEKSVWDYNQGNPDGAPETLGQQPRPQTPLVAFYPRDGTVISDSPYAVLDAPWVDDAKRAAAADLLDWLRKPAQQLRFQQAAFRDDTGAPGPVISPENGLQPPDGPLKVLTPPNAAVLDEIVRSWSTVRKRANLTFVMDVSGSMNDKVSSSPEAPTKLDLAKQAAVDALGKLAPDDTLSLWTFSTPQSGETAPYRVLVPPGQTSATGGPVRAAVTALTPNGGTALYATARASVERVQETFDPNRINAVVLLTDGQNEYPADNDLARLLTDLASGEQSTPVRVFPIAYGPQANLDVLTKIAHAGTGAAYDARVPGTIERVLDDVISNF